MNTRHESLTGAGTDPGDKSSADIEREVRQQRADVERTLDAIQERLSPGQLVDEAMSYLRQGGGAEFFRNLGDSVKHNPVPIALIGVGVAWMMASSARSNGRRASEYWIEEEPDDWDELDDLDDYESGVYAESGAYAADYPYGTTAGTAPGGLGEAGAGTTYDPSLGASSTSGSDEGPGLGERARAAAAGAREKADELRRRARDAVGDAGSRASEMGAKARARMARASRDVSGRAERARSSARRYTSRARQGLLHTLNEQPLVLGAIGLAVGAALGSALPASEREDRLMGGTRDRLKRRAMEAGREQVDKVEAAAGAAYDAAREEAERQGLTPEGGKEALHAARQKVERVAEAATTAGREAAERQSSGSTTGPTSTSTTSSPS